MGSSFLVIGSGAAVAKELASRGAEVTVVEKGGMNKLGTSWRALKFYSGSFRPGEMSAEGTELLRTIMIGGSTMVTLGNGVRALQTELRDAGVDIDKELKEAERELKVVATPESFFGARTRILRDSSIELGYDVKPMPKFVDFKRCRMCGACVLGCRYGAKNTLDKNYLYLAENKFGATIFSETEVTGVRPSEDGYEIFTRKSTGLRHPQKTFKAHGVVFSGGVMGTVKLLLQCKNNGLLPGISDQLGNVVRTNSEALLGVTARDKNADYSDHLAITSGIYPDEKTHIEIVRYNKGSDVMGALLTLLTGGGGKIPRVVRFVGNILRHPWEFLKSLWIVGWAARTPILLVMQTEENFIRLSYKPRWWRLGRPSMNTELVPGAEKVPSYIPIANQVAQKMGEKIDGQPKSSMTEVLFDVASTAHILGGCVMGETAAEGVVDFNGEIHGYPNLYVADGSNVPVNLGVNPSLTITAIAEYIMSQIAENPQNVPVKS